MGELLCEFQQHGGGYPFVRVMAGIIKDPIAPLSRRHEPQRSAHDAFSDLTYLNKRVPCRDAPHAVGCQRGGEAYRRGYDVEGQRHRHAAADPQIFRVQAGICRVYSLKSSSVLLSEREKRVAAVYAVHRVARVPRDERPVRRRPDETVGDKAVIRLKMQHRISRLRSENTVERKRSVARAAERELQELYRRPFAPVF